MFTVMLLLLLKQVLMDVREECWTDACLVPGPGTDLLLHSSSIVLLLLTDSRLQETTTAQTPSDSRMEPFKHSIHTYQAAHDTYCSIPWPTPQLPFRSFPPDCSSIR